MLLVVMTEVKHGKMTGA